MRVAILAAVLVCLVGSAQGVAGAGGGRAQTSDMDMSRL
jgi:hypothetical protein